MGKPFFTISKKVGETPLQALERLRRDKKISTQTPLAYAGRLDPMASGQLLILHGDECKVQEQYHSLDKEYDFEILLGVGSDTHDVLGIVKKYEANHPTDLEVKHVLRKLVGKVTLPYPHFSSKTVKGKPLHMWTLEGRLSEIEIPTKTSTIHSLTLTSIRTTTAQELLEAVRKKVDSIPPVTDPRKALGEDFRRVDVHASWDAVICDAPGATYTILSLSCVCSSGTYMRTLASIIGERLGTKALAYSIHRSRIGKYFGIPGIFGLWVQTYAKDGV